MLAKYETLKNAILDGDGDIAISEFQSFIAAGETPIGIMTGCVEPTLNELGDQFARMEVFLPELIVAADVANALNAVIEETLSESAEQYKSKGKAVICTVYGDVHDIGKNIVALMLKVNGIDVIDLGVDVSPVKIAEEAEKINADLVCLSALMLPSLPYMRETIQLVHNNRTLAGKTKIMVGGGPVTKEWADKNGADGYGDDAVDAVKLAFRLLEGNGGNKA
ncbi:MAG: cobalamin-dependent protein [Bacillota bacterium]